MQEQKKCTDMPAQNNSMALPPLHCADFIDYILTHQNPPTTLIICATRDAFVENLQRSINNTHRPGPSASQASTASAQVHPILVPTINLIAQSKDTHLVFVPTLPHLRAYLAAHVIPTVSNPSPTPPKPTAQFPLLAVWGLARLHRSTADFSAQGISRTLAAAVEAARLGGQRLMLAEALDLRGEDEYDEDDGVSSSSDNLWKEQIPLLSGSVRYGGHERAWAGRTVEVGKVVAKWCKFMQLGREG